MELTVATFNIYKHEDFEHRLPAILAVLREAAADIVCLQEVPPDLQMARHLADSTGYEHVAECSFTRPDDGWSEALGVLSHFALTAHEPLDLRPGVPNCFRARAATPAGVIDIYNAHLHPRDSELRQREASVIVERLSQEPDVPAVVCGDFNAVPEGRTMAVVWPQLRSAYEVANGSHPETTFPTPLRPLAGRQPGFSERREAPPSDDEGQAKAAIDYVLLRPSQLDAFEARLLGSQPVRGVWPSDHMGVVVRLAVLSRD